MTFLCFKFNSRTKKTTKNISKKQFFLLAFIAQSAKSQIKSTIKVSGEPANEPIYNLNNNNNNNNKKKQQYNAIIVGATRITSQAKIFSQLLATK